MTAVRWRVVVRRWWPPVAIVGGLSLVTLYVFLDVIASGGRLPGIDAPIHYAWEVYTRSALASGRWPFWNPYFWAGTPHFADATAGVAYPPAVLFRAFPTAASLGWLALAHIVAGGAGVLYLARVVGLRWLSASAAALAVTLGGAVGSWLHLGHLVIIYSVVWLPWALGLAMVTVARRTLLPHPALPLVLTLVLLAGHIQFMLYVVAAVSLYFLYSAAWPPLEADAGRRWRPVAQLAITGAITFGLCAPQLFPLLRFADESTRMAGLPFARAASGGWEFRDVATLFWPFMDVAQAPVARVLSHRVAYVGWVLMCVAPLAFAGARYRRSAFFFATLALGAALLAFGANTPLFAVYHALFPGFRIPGRVLFLMTLSLAMIGAMGLETFAALAQERRWRPLAAVLAVSGLAAAAAFMLGERSSMPAGVHPAHLWPWLPAIALAGIAAVALLVASNRARLALAAAVLALAVDLAGFASGAVATVPIEPVETLRQWLGPSDTGRVWSLCPGRVDSNELLITARPGLTGPVGLVMARYMDWLDMVSAADQPETLGRARVRRDLLNAANVSTIVSCEPIDAPQLPLLSNVRPVFTYRNEQAWPRAIWTCGAMEMRRALVAEELRLGRYDAVGVLARRLSVNIRWVAGVPDERRRALEERYRLTGGVRREGTTFRYALSDLPAQTGLALVADPAVEDTAGIDRQSGEWVGETRPADTAGDEPELLIGTVRCAGRAAVDVIAIDQPDGRVTVDVNAPASGGFVFFSEPFYEERRAFVDGQRAAARRANLAFTAVQVPAGRHRVELRYVPVSFHAGLGVTGATVLLWIFVSGAMRRRSVPSSKMKPLPSQKQPNPS